MGKILPMSFYNRETDKVAISLLGKILARRLPSGEVLKCVITETEAYLGIADKACHTYGGRKTERTLPMWEAGGRAYIYFIYGMYYCLNIVTRESGVPEAVLIRGARPLETPEQINKWLKIEPRTSQWKKIMSGPGKLCRTLEIDKSLNRIPLNSKELWLEDGYQVARKTILKSPRVGIGYAGEAASWPLRFLWNSGSVYESVFRHNQNDRKNAACKITKSRS